MYQKINILSLNSRDSKITCYIVYKNDPLNIIELMKEKEIEKQMNGTYF